MFVTKSLTDKQSQSANVI